MGSPTAFKELGDRPNLQRRKQTYTKRVSTGYIPTHHIQRHTTRSQAAAKRSLLEEERERHSKGSSQQWGRGRDLGFRRLVCNHPSLLAHGAWSHNPGTSNHKGVSTTGELSHFWCFKQLLSPKMSSDQISSQHWLYGQHVAYMSLLSVTRMVSQILFYRSYLLPTQSSLA